MKDWKSWKESVQAMSDAARAGMFVHVDTLIELVDTMRDMVRALVHVAKTGDLCEYCANKPDFEKCADNDMLCYDCKRACVCKDCHDFAGFVWAGSKPEPVPEVTVSDEAPADPASARWTISMLADGSVIPLEIGERPGLEQLQTMVGGYIETLEFRIPGRGVRFVGVFDEEGKLKNLPVNELATREFMAERSRLAGDYLAGTVLLLKIEGEDIVSLTTEETAMLMRCLDKEWEAQV